MWSYILKTWFQMNDFLSIRTRPEFDARNLPHHALQKNCVGK